MMIEKLFLEYAGEAGQSGVFLLIIGWCIMQVKSIKTEVREMRAGCKETHNKIDEKFETVMEKLEHTNLRLERACTLLEERTHQNP